MNLGHYSAPLLPEQNYEPTYKQKHEQRTSNVLAAALHVAAQRRCSQAKVQSPASHSLYGTKTHTPPRAASTGGASTLSATATPPHYHVGDTIGGTPSTIASMSLTSSPAQIQNASSPHYQYGRCRGAENRPYLRTHARTGSSAHGWRDSSHAVDSLSR